MQEYVYKYPMPSLTTDIILIKNDSILLIKRKNNPYKDCWAFPGGFVEKDEDLVDGAKRELLEETSIKDIELKQFKAFGKPFRDPRGWTVTVVFYGFLQSEVEIKAMDDAKEIGWHSLKNLPQLAFDHKEILEEFLLWYDCCKLKN